MSKDSVNSKNKWELPAIGLMIGLVITSIGISKNIIVLCCLGLIIILISIFGIIKIRMKTIDENIKDLEPDNDLEERDWHNHSYHFHL